MNNKISRYQLGMILFMLYLSLYIGINDVILLNKSNNQVFISVILGSIIGIIPLFMYLKLSNIYPEDNLYEKNLKLFGKDIGNIFNIIFILLYTIFFAISINSTITFISSKYLESTPSILLASLIITVCIIISFKGLEVISRMIQLSFIFSIFFMIIVEVFLIKYVNLYNIFPMITGNNYIKNIIDGAIYYASSTALIIPSLLVIKKSSIKDNHKLNKTIIIFYLLASISLLLVMFFLISCYNYNISSLFKYPEYIVLKKIGFSGSDLHLENLLAFRWILYTMSFVIISIYGIRKGICTFIKNTKISKILTIVICILTFIISDKIINNSISLLIFMKNKYVYFIGLPIFILLALMLVKSYLTKKH